MSDQTESAIQKFTRVASEHGWVIETPGDFDKDGNYQRNPKAFTHGDSTYPTLCMGGVKVALSNRELYYHRGWVWVMDDCRPNLVVIAAIIVDPEMRRSRRGTGAMQAMMRYADVTGITLLLEAQPMKQFKAKGITQKRLIEWYTRLGFKAAYPEEGRELLKYTPKESSGPHGEEQAITHEDGSVEWR